MRVLLFSDAHGDWKTGGVERYDEVCRAFDQVHAYATTRKVDLALFLGDLCNPDRDVPQTHRFISYAVGFGLALKASGVASIWLPGNHDVIEDGRGSHTLMALEKAGLFVASRPVLVNRCDTDFVLLPYVSTVNRYDPDAFVRATRSTPYVRRCVVAGHMTRIRGVTLGSETSDMPRGADMEFPIDAVEALATRYEKVIACNGHFHERVVDGPVLIPGSLARLTHGEERNEPGFLVVDV